MILKKVYIGYLTSIINKSYNLGKIDYEYKLIKTGIFYHMEEILPKYKDLETDISYKNFSFCENGDVAFYDTDKISIENYFLKNGIKYKPFMTKDEIFKCVYKMGEEPLNNEEKSILPKLIRKITRK